MKVKLNDIRETSALGYGRNALVTIAFLQSFKKEGSLFYQENIECLGEDSEFEIYYYLSPYPTTLNNAFPIPIEQFQFFNNHSDEWDFLHQHYQKYYRKIVSDLREFSKYDYKRPYVGRKYVF